MRRFVRFLAATAVAATALTPAAASAACTLADFAGRWHVYTSGIQNGQAAWVRCRVIIQANGSVNNTSCFTPTGQALPLTGGEVRITSPAICVYQGGFNLAGSTNQVRHLTLSLNKQTASGVGFTPGTGAFTLELVKTGN